MHEFIVASRSLTRVEVLRNAGLAFSTDPADVDELALASELKAAAPDAVAQHLATAKALAVTARHPGQIVLGADQVLALEGQVVTKSADLAAAHLTLRRLSGRRHALHSGLALVRDGTVLWQHIDSAFLDMRRLSDAEIERYLATGDAGILAAVGCYRIEGPGIQLFERIAGDHFTILGLPLLPLLAELRRLAVLA